MNPADIWEAIEQVIEDGILPKSRAGRMVLMAEIDRLVAATASRTRAEVLREAEKGIAAIVIDPNKEQSPYWQLGAARMRHNAVEFIRALSPATNEDTERGNGSETSNGEHSSDACRVVFEEFGKHDTWKVAGCLCSCHKAASTSREKA